MALSLWLKDEQELFIDGPTGQLQCGFSPAVNTNAPAVLVCHPHPQFQGTMFNKVVTTTVKAARAQGLQVLRFNYRGVQKSQGQYDQGVGEVDDAKAAAQWLETKTLIKKICLVGFSFGASIAYRLHNRVACERLVLLCPSVLKMAFPKPCIAPMHVIQAQADTVVDPVAVADWVKAYPQAKWHPVQGASHFFDGKLLELQALLEKCLPQSGKTLD